MSILFGLISLFISILIPTLILAITDFQVMGFSLFFVIPVGAIAIGYICGFGYYKGLIKSNTYISKKHLLIGVVFALFCILGIKYAEYALTYVDPMTGEIIYAMSGVDHISNYGIEGYGKLNFINFTRFVIESTPVSFSYKARSLGEISNPSVSWIFAIIDFLGVIAGYLYVGISRRALPYCHSCQLYKKQTKLIKIAKDNGSKFFEELKECADSEEPEKSTLTLLDEYKSIDVPKKTEYYQATLVRCENCKDASLKFDLYELNSKKQLVMNSNFEYNVDIDKASADSIIQQIV